jgi:renalase
MFDVAVVGAGMAGLICAQRLRHLGYQVVVLEKSRGLGGRVATRRLPDTWADHGLRCLEEQGTFSRSLVQTLLEQEVIHLWTDTIHMSDDTLDSNRVQKIDRHPRYVSSEGMTAIAKFLATGLEIWRGQRVQAIAHTPEQTWTLTLEAAKAERVEPKCVIAKSLVLAIPAPQVVPLLAPFAEQMPDLWAAVQSVKFAPCITAIATYDPESAVQLAEIPWKAMQFAEPSDLAWIGLETSKHPESAKPVIVAQSSAPFADRHLESSDLKSVGQQLLRAAEDLLPWLSYPEELQVHRWRYGFVTEPIAELCLSTHHPLPLLCCGDWCGGSQIESALRSGWAAAVQAVTLI